MIDNLYLLQDQGGKGKKIPGSSTDQMIQLSRDKVEDYVLDLSRVKKSRMI